MNETPTTPETKDAPPASKPAKIKLARSKFAIFFHVVGWLLMALAAFLLVRSIVDSLHYVADEDIVALFLVGLLFHLLATVLTWIYNIMVNTAEMRRRG